jgi:hypothetical protein
MRGRNPQQFQIGPSTWTYNFAYDASAITRIAKSFDQLPKPVYKIISWIDQMSFVELGNCGLNYFI